MAGGKPPPYDDIIIRPNSTRLYCIRASIVNGNWLPMPSVVFRAAKLTANLPIPSGTQWCNDYRPAEHALARRPAVHTLTCHLSTDTERCPMV